MRRRSIWLAIVVVAILASGVGWWVTSPWWTLKSMRDAIRADDNDRLASYIDFPRVRADLRDQLIQDVKARLPPNYFSPLVVKQGARLIADPIVDLIVSPKSLKLALDIAPKSESSDGASKQNCGMTREDLNHFRFRCARLPGGQADLRFERQGFGWKLVGIDLPDDYGAKII